MSENIESEKSGINDPKVIDRTIGALVGLAIGDALGTTLEFSERDKPPLHTEIKGGGPWNLEPGKWTDDTSMALCTATSLVETGSFDAVDQLDRYVRWWREGYLSSMDRCVDIGSQTQFSLADYRYNKLPYRIRFKPFDSGNGGIMRLSPVPMAFHHDVLESGRLSVLNSRTTHATEECKDAAMLFGELIATGINTGDKSEVLAYSKESAAKYASAKINLVASGSFVGTERRRISSSGYVVTSLEAALWAFNEADNFRDGLILAVNLGGDADTIGAIYGQLAGAVYGEISIPRDWTNSLYQYDEIKTLAGTIAKQVGTFAVTEYAEYEW